MNPMEQNTKTEGAGFEHVTKGFAGSHMLNMLSKRTRKEAQDDQRRLLAKRGRDMEDWEQQELILTAPGKSLTL